MSRYLAGEGGFPSEHFSEERHRDPVGECTIRPAAEVGRVVRF